MNYNDIKDQSVRVCNIIKASSGRALQKIINEVETLGLDNSRIYAQRFLKELNELDGEEMFHRVEDPRKRFHDETDTLALFFISKDHLNTTTLRVRLATTLPLLSPRLTMKQRNGKQVLCCV